jgi:hypothetical protein
VLAGALVVTLALLGGEATAGPKRATLTTITVDTLPIANALPLDLGIAKGFFSNHGIEIKKQILQSGNDIVLALANHNGDIGYLGYTPMMIARTQSIPITLLAASEVEGTSTADNWQNVLVKGNSSIRSPADLAGKTIAVNALKGVSEVVIKAALKKLGVDPNSIKLLAIPFPSMRTALNNGQVDAIHVPEPFLTRVHLDGDRIGSGADARKLLAERRLRSAGRLDQVQPGAREELPSRNERVGRVRAVAPGRDPRAPAGGIAEHPPGHLVIGDRPHAAARAREGCEGVRRDRFAAEFHAALSERHSKWVRDRVARGVRRQEGRPQASGQGAVAARPRDVPPDHQGHVEDSRIPDHGPGRHCVHRRKEYRHRASHHHPPARALRLHVRGRRKDLQRVLLRQLSSVH